MSREPKLCCNCLHCARWQKKDGIECHCDLTDKYLGYLDVMDEDNNCKHWEKEIKWDLEKEHDEKIRADERRKCGEELLKRINEKECGIEKKNLWLISQIKNICFDIPRICDLEGAEK